MSDVKNSISSNNSNPNLSTNVSMNDHQGALNAVQIDQLLSLLSYSVKNKNRTDQLANVGLEITVLDQLCQKFSSTFPLKTDAFRVSCFTAYFY